MSQKPFLGVKPFSLVFGENDVNTAPRRLLRDTAVVDPDFNGGTLTISGLAIDDRIGIAADGEVTRSGAELYVSGVGVGTISGGIGMQLTITFRSFADVTEVEAVLESLTFQNLSDTPTPMRDLTITLTDETGQSWYGQGAGFSQIADPWRPIRYDSTGRPYELDLDGYYGAISAPAVYDANGDGRAEGLAIGTLEGNVRYFAYENDGRFVERFFAANPFLFVEVGVGASDGSPIEIDGVAKPTFGDFDLDGDADLVVGTIDGTLRTWENQAGSFVELTGSANPFRSIDAGLEAAPAFVVDDERVNLVVGGADGRLQMFLQLGPDLYSPLAGFESVDVGENAALSAADIDGDGRADLVVGSADGTFRTFINGPGYAFNEQTGSGNPLAGLDVGLGSAPTFIDLNGDGRLDVVSGTTGGGLVTYTQGGPLRITVAAENDVPQMFGLPANLRVGENASNAAPQRFAPGATFKDGDLRGGTITVSGLLAEDRVGLATDDVVSVSGSSVTIGGAAIGTIAGGNGTTFTVSLLGTATAAAVETLLQHLTYQTVSDAPTNLRDLSVVVTDDAGIRSDSRQPMSFGASAEPSDRHPGLGATAAMDFTSPALADLNRDGRVDIVVLGQNQNSISADNAKAFGQNADGSFSELTGAQDPLAGLRYTFGRPAFVDLNGDGRLDLVVGTQTDFAVALQGSDGVFVEADPADFLPGVARSSYMALAFGDINNDGRFDAVTGDDTGTLGIYLQAPGGQFRLQNLGLPITSSGGAFVPTLADLNADGRLDVVIGESSGRVRAFMQDPFGRFVESTGTSNPLSAISLVVDYGTSSNIPFATAPAFGDVDGDGDLDLVLGGELNGPLRFFTNIATPPSPSKITIRVDAERELSVITGGLTGAVTEAGGVSNRIAGIPVAADRLFARDTDGRTVEFEKVDAGARARFGTYDVDDDGRWAYQLDNANADVQRLQVGDRLVDSFTLRTEDGAEAVVRITIAGANDAAVISGATTGALLEAGGRANDAAGTPVAAGRLFATDVDDRSDSFREIASGTRARYGLYEVDDDGHWTYRLDNADEDVQELRIGEQLTDRFDVRSEDGTTHVVSLTITGADDAAVISGIATGSVVEAGGVANGTAGTSTATGKLIVEDPDKEPREFLAITSGTASTGGYGTVQMDRGGVWAYRLDDANAAVQALAAGATLADTFTARATDGTAQVVTVLIRGANDAAAIGGASTGAVVEDAEVANGKLSADGALTIADPDAGEAGFVPEAGVAGAFGTFELAAEGGWTYAAANGQSAIQALGLGETLTDSFTARSQDGTATQVVTVTIEGANDTAVIGGDTVRTVTEDEAVRGLDLRAAGRLTVADADAGQSSFRFNSPISQYGGFVLYEDGVWEYGVLNGMDVVQALGAGQFLTDSFTASSLDGTEQVVTVAILGANDEARIEGTLAGTVIEDELADDTNLMALGTLAVIDVDAGEATLQTPSVMAGLYGSFELYENNNWVYLADNSQAEIQALGASDEAIDTFTLVSQDGTAVRTVTIAIEGANDEAVIGGVTGGTTTEDATVVGGDLVAAGALTIADPDAGQSSFQPLSGIAGQYGRFDLSADGAWTYAAVNGQAAVQALGAGQSLADAFTARSQDGTTTQVVTVTIGGANDPALIGGVVSGSVTEAGSGNAGGRPAVSGTLAALDLDGPADTFRPVAAGTASTVGFGTFGVTAGGTWAYRLDNANAAVQALGAGEALVDTFTVATEDGTMQAVSVTIAGADDVPPTIDLLDDTGSSVSDRITSNAALSGTAEPGATVTVRDGTVVLGTTVANGSGQWSFAPAGLAEGGHSLSATATDTAGNTGTASLSLAVTLDSSAPSPALGSVTVTDTGASASDRVTASGAVTVSGSVEAGASVVIFDGPTALGAATLSGDTFSFATSLADGTHALRAVATDAAGNTGSSASSAAITVDTAAPAVAITAQMLAADTSASASDRITSNGAVTLSGTVEAGASVRIFDGASALGVASVSGGTFSFSTRLAEGVHALRAVATDLAGNEASTASQPTISVVATQEGTVIDGYLAGATVFGDADGDGTLDAGEASTTTDGQGRFTLEGASGPLVARGGTDISTGLPFAGVLTAPAGAAVITPLTTLVQELAEAGVADPIGTVKAAFGVPGGFDLLTVDPVAASGAGDPAAADVLVAGIQVQATASLIAAALAGAGASASAAIVAAVDAIAGAIAPGGALDLTSRATITALGSAAGLGSAGADAAGRIAAAANAALELIDDGASFLDAIAVLQASAQGEAAAALQAAGSDPAKLNEVASKFENELDGSGGVDPQPADRSLFGTVLTDASGPAGQIYEIFQGLLGRAPDPTGFAVWLEALAQGSTLAHVAASILASSEYEGLHGAFTDETDTGFVSELYAVVLGRAADTSGELFWNTALDSGMARADLALAFALSAENVAQDAAILSAGVFAPDPAAGDVARLYYGLLDRAPDSGGLRFWTEAVKSGLPEVAVADAMLGSAEYAARTGALSSESFLVALYDNALGRAPDAGGLTFWLGQLEAGQTRAQVALEISDSQEANAALLGVIENGWHLA